MKEKKLNLTIKKLREHLDLEQKELAMLVGVSVFTISSMESRRNYPLTGELATRVGFATGVDAQWLLANDPDAPFRSWLEADELKPICEKAGFKPMNAPRKLVCKIYKDLAHAEIKRLQSGEYMEMGIAAVHFFWFRVIRLIKLTEHAINTTDGGKKMKYRIFLIKLDRMLARLESDFGDGSEASTDLEQAIGCAVSGRDAVALDSPKLKSVLQIQPLSKAVSGILLRKEKSK